MDDIVSTQVQAGGADSGAAAAAALPNFADVIPAEYKEKQWVQEHAKNSDPFGALFKGYESAQQLIGKMANDVKVPGSDATPEALQAFHKALGVPEKPEGYEYASQDISKEPEKVQAALKEMAKDTRLLDAMRPIMHKAGVTPTQFKEIVGAFDSHTLNQVKAMVEGQEAANQKAVEEQLSKAKTLYGDKYDAIHKVAMDTAEKVLPEAVRNARDPEIALMEALKFIHENVFKGDSIARPGAAAPETGDSVREEIMRVRQSPAFRNWQDPGHAEAKERVKALYEREAQMKGEKVSA